MRGLGLLLICFSSLNTKLTPKFSLCLSGTLRADLQRLAKGQTRGFRTVRRPRPNANYRATFARTRKGSAKETDAGLPHNAEASAKRQLLGTRRTDQLRLGDD